MYKNKSNNSHKSNSHVAVNVLKISFLCGAIALASGCGKTIKPEASEPRKLVQLEQSVNVVSPVFSTSLKGNSKLADVNRFEVGFNGNKIVAASGAGIIDSYTITGQKLWSIDVGEDILGGLSFDASSNTAIVSTRSARVIAIDTTNGNIKWTTNLDGTILAPALIHNNRVILSGNDGVMHGLSLQNGNSIWQFSTSTPSISVRGSAKPALLDAQTVVLASADGRLHAVDVETGIPKWSRRVGIPSGASEIQRMTDIDGTPTVHDGQLFAVTYSGQLIGFDLSSGQALFIQESASKNSLAVAGNAVISTTLDGLIKVHNRQTGELIWQTDELAYRQLSNPVMIGNYIAVGDLEGVVHFLSPENGQIVSRTSTKGPINKLQSESGYLLTQTKSGQVNVWRLNR